MPVHIRKSEVKNIDPETMKVKSIQTYFVVDVYPEADILPKGQKPSSTKSLLKYPKYKRQTTRRVDDYIERTNKTGVASDE